MATKKRISKLKRAARRSGSLSSSSGGGKLNKAQAASLAGAAAAASAGLGSNASPPTRQQAAALAEAAVAKAMGDTPGKTSSAQDRRSAAEAAAAATAEHLGVKLANKGSATRAEAMQAIEAMQKKWKAPDAFGSPQEAAMAAAQKKADRLSVDPENFKNMSERAKKYLALNGIELNKNLSLTRQEAAKEATAAALRRVDFSKIKI